MRIAVNTRFLIKDKLEGIGWFTYETLKRITQNHPEHQFYFFFDRDFPDEFVFSDNIEPVVLFPPARHPVLWYWWFEWSVTRALKKVNADVFLSTDGFLSLSTKVKTALVIHDIAFEHFPEHVDWAARKYLQHYSRKFAQKADRIATVSEFSRQDLAKTYHIPEDKIDVVYNGANELYHPYEPDEVTEEKEKHGLADQYFIYAGAVQPRKNVDKLLQAFDAFRAKTGAKAQLAIAGRKAWKYEDTMQVYEQMQFKKDVKWLGHLRTESLAKLMNGALALVYVSKFEGFGIPLIEAMNCETPVITSNISSMPEVASDAGLLVNPESVNETADAMEKISQDQDLRQSLIEKGNQRKQQFSWKRTSELLWDSLMKVTKPNS